MRRYQSSNGKPPRFNDPVIDRRGGPYQKGGSIFDYSTDPSGMRDPDYARAIPLEITFVSKADSGTTQPRYQVEGKPAKLGRCPKS